MSDICLSVILSPLGTPLTYLSIGSSSERSPSSAALSRRVAVKVLVMLPILWCTSGVIGSPEARSATPRARTHVYSGVCTAATTPGASLSLNDFFSAASRSAVGACSLPPAVCLPSPETFRPLPPLHPIPSRSTNTVTKMPTFHARWYVILENIADSSLLLGLRIFASGESRGYSKASSYAPGDVGRGYVRPSDTVPVC